MKTRIHLIAGFTMFVFCISICTATANATVIWSDDFDDGDYDGWTICENSPHYGGAHGFDGSTWNATNNYLEVTQAPDSWGIISHPSDVAYGTWSFDFKDNDVQSRFGDTAMVVFISNDFYDLDDFEQEANYYWIDFDIFTSENYTINLKKKSGASRTIIDTTKVPAAGWHHFDVTRNTTGCFSVYHNDTHILQGEDTEIDTSELFWLWFKEAQMIDNIVVSDTVDVVCTDPDCELCHPTTTPTSPTTPTTTTHPPAPPPPPDWVPIGIIGASAVVIVAVLVIILRRR